MFCAGVETVHEKPANSTFFENPLGASQEVSTAERAFFALNGTRHAGRDIRRRIGPMMARQDRGAREDIPTHRRRRREKTKSFEFCGSSES